MANDDFVRVKYTRIFQDEENATRKKGTSVSIDPDLFFVFCSIRGGAPAARAQIRTWAVDADKSSADYQRIGISRLVHRQMMTEIREIVDLGLQAKEAGFKNQKTAARQRSH